MNEILYGEFKEHEQKNKIYFIGKSKSKNNIDINKQYEIYILDEV